MGFMTLPPDLTATEFDTRFRVDPDAWIAAIDEVCAVHGLPSAAVAPVNDGSNLVAFVDDRWVVKVFPPFHRHQWESEWRVLSYLGEHVQSIPADIPRLIAKGVRGDDWPYVIVSKLPGETLESVWPSLSLGEKSNLMAEIGKIISQVHRVSP